MSWADDPIVSGGAATIDAQASTSPWESDTIVGETPSGSWESDPVAEDTAASPSWESLGFPGRQQQIANDEQAAGEAGLSVYDLNLKRAADAEDSSLPGRMIGGAISSAADAVVNPLLAAESALGFETAGDMLQERQSQADMRGLSQESWMERQVSGIVNSIAQAGTLTATGGGLAGMLTSFGTQAYSNAERQALKEGKTGGEASTIGRAVAAVEVGVMAAFQRAGLGGMEQAFLKSSPWQGVKNFAIQTLGELGEEELTTIGQELAQSGEVNGKALVDTAVQSIGTMGLVGGAQKIHDFVTNPSRRTAKEAGVDAVAPTYAARKTLAAKLDNALTADQFKKQLYDTATSVEEGDAILGLVEARAESAGESLNDYVGKRIKGIVRTDRSESVAMKQGTAIAPRGEIQFVEDGRAIIRAFEGSQNATTLAHEIGHLFRRDLADADLRTASQWAGAKKGAWDRNAEEKFARGFERYLRDGVAPTKKLESVFAHFKDWLSRIYSKLSASPLNLGISPEMRGVYDGLFLPQADARVREGVATETQNLSPAEIERAAEEMTVSPVENDELVATTELAESALRQAPAATTPTAAKNEAMDLDRGMMELPSLMGEFSPGNTNPWPVAMEQARKAKIPERAMSIADEVLKKPRALDDKETIGLTMHGVTLKNQYAAIQEDLNNETLDAATLATRAAEAERIEQDFDVLSRALKAAGTEQGRALASRKLSLDADYTPLAVQARAVQKKGGKQLTPKEKRKINKVVKEHEDAEKKIVEQEQKEAAVKTTGRKKIKDEVKKLKEKVAKAKLPTDLTKYARDLAKQFLADGVIGRRELVDKVQKAVREVFPETQRRQVIDAISGYGDFTQLSKDEVSVRLRDLKGQLQQIGKLKDMAEGKAPAKTGMERRDPSDVERGLIKEVNEAKKEGGYVVTDPEKQLASALGTIKTRLRNQIKDLQDQIESRQKLIKTKKASPADEESARLTAERDVLKTQFEEIFGKPEMTAEQRVAIAERAVQKTIDEYERRLAAGDFAPRPQRHNNPVPEKLAAMRDKAAALKKKYAETNPNPPAVEKAKERLAVLEAHLAAGTLPSTTPRPATTNKAAATIQQQLADVRKQLTQSEPAQRARLTKAMGELQAKLDAGEFSLPEGAARPVSPEIERLQYERDKLRRKIRFEVNSLKPQSAWGVASQPFNTARQIITTLDFPPVFRQGGFIALGNPVRAAKATGAGFKAMFSDRGARKMLAEINARPNAPLYARAKLYLADMDGSASAREEAFVGRLVHKIPGVRKVVEASERNYTVFLNQLRADTFDSMASSLARNGEPTMAEAQAIAKFINVATGRGDFGQFEAAMTGLAPVFFSPRYVASRFQLLAGQPMYGGTMDTRKLVAKEYAKAAIGAGVVYALAMAAGAELEDDPTSSDFGKLKFGNSRLDPLGGLSQSAVITARMGAGVKKTLDSWTTGKPRESNVLKDEGRMAWNFLRSKFSPLAAMPMNMAIGETAGREAVTPGQLAKDLTVPLSFRDLRSTVEEQGVPAGVAMWLVSMFGMGLQTYDAKGK